MASVLLFALVTIGALISSLTGLGGGTLILAGLLLVYPPELAIPLHSFTQLSANLLRAGLFHRAVNWKVVGAYSVLMLPFAWLGAKTFHMMNPDWLKILVSIFILISIYPWKNKSNQEPTSFMFVILGAFSGFLGIFVGAVGPMVMPFFNKLKISRDGMIATKSVGQMLLQLSKIIAFTGAAGVDFISLRENVGILVAGTLLGVGISVPISRKISAERFNLILNIFLALIAFKLFYEGVSSFVE